MKKTKIEKDEYKVLERHGTIIGFSYKSNAYMVRFDGETEHLWRIYPRDCMKGVVRPFFTGQRVKQRTSATWETDPDHLHSCAWFPSDVPAPTTPEPTPAMTKEPEPPIVQSISLFRAELQLPNATRDIYVSGQSMADVEHWLLNSPNADLPPVRLINLIALVQPKPYSASR